MDMTHTNTYANRLYAAHGNRAEYEAAQKARACAQKGDTAEAEQWQQVREKIRMLRGPGET